MIKSVFSKQSVEFLKNSVAQAMDDYEIRDPQLRMLEACADTIQSGGRLMAEAGTGTGKTFAYLIPLILSGKKGIISTRTINLQEQLAAKDLKFLSRLTKFKYAVAKGRGNYLCLRRFNAYRTHDSEEAGEYKSLLNWISETATGDAEDYGHRRSILWEKVQSDGDACRSRKCGHFRECFYFKARQWWEQAQIVVANHALVSINALLPDDTKILPQAEALVIDEAHALDTVLSDHIGISITRTGFERTLNTLLRPDERGAYKGLLSHSPELFDTVDSLRREMELFWYEVKNRLKHREMIRGVVAVRDLLIALSATVKELADDIRKHTRGLFEEDDELEVRAAIIKLKTFAEGMETFADGMDGFVRWAEIEENRIGLRMAPVYPRDFFKSNIIPAFKSIILTSATLSVAGDFSFFEHILGLEGSKQLTVPSPFNLSKQMSVSVRKGINLMSSQGAGVLADVIIEEAEVLNGGMLVLFTSRESMKRTWEFAHRELTDIGFNPMLQGGIPNRTMLEKMRGSENSVIFGLDSFWEGVDVKGDSLKCLIITKLPFEVPSEPIALARTEEIERTGGKPFYDYSLPRAVLKFRQGIGRLIRSKTDTGRIVICDERIETKAYGRKFFDSIK